jgi:chromosome partitioning protein
MVRTEGSKKETRATKYVSLVAPKGGVGKTTLSMSLLVSAARAGYRVHGINMDPQQSLDKWSIKRAKNIALNPGGDIPPIPVHHIEPGEWRSLAAYSDFDFVVVDTPPGHSDQLKLLQSVCGISDLVLIPTSASGIDLDEVVPFWKSIGNDKAAFILNRVNRRTRSYISARNRLVTKGRLCAVDIPSLDIVSTQFLKGLAITDMDEGVAWESFDALWQFVRREVGLQTRVLEDA